MSTEQVTKRGRGRSPYTMSVEHRIKIGNSNTLKYLLDHIEGKREMSASQVTAGLGLLKKVLPDLQSTELTGDADNPIETVTRIQLVAPNGHSAD